MLQSTRTNTLFEQIIREEYSKKKQQQLLDSLHEQMDIANAANSAKSGADSVPKLPAGTGAGTLATVGGAMPAATPKFKSKLVTGSQVKDPNYKMKNPWSDTKAMAILKQLGAKPYPLTGFEDQFELVVPQGQSLTDRLRFSKDGQVYSGTYGGYLSWKIVGDAIELSIQTVADRITGKIVILGKLVAAGGKYPVKFIADANLNKQIQQKLNPNAINAGDKKTAGEIIDELQGLLDWAGVVPVYGDAIDLINASVYFARGKYFDGLFSCIAIVPLLGSIYSLGAKTLKKSAAYALRSIPKLRKFKSIDEFIIQATDQELGVMWSYWAKNKLIKPGDLVALKNTFAGFNNLFKSRSFKMWVRGAEHIVPGTALFDKQIMRGLDDAAEFFGRQSKGADLAVDITKTGEKAGKTAGEEIAQHVVSGGDKSTGQLLLKMMNKGIFKSGRVIGKAEKAGFKKALFALLKFSRVPNLIKLTEVVRRNMQTKLMEKFLKQWGNSTNSIAMLLKTTQAAEVYALELVKKLQKQKEVLEYMGREFPTATPKEIMQKISNAFIDPKTGKLMPTKTLIYSLNQLNSINKLFFEQVRKDILKYIVDNGNYIFTTYMTDATKQFAVYFTRSGDKFAKTLGKEFWGQVTSFRKHVDWITSELEDITEWAHTAIDPSSYYEAGSLESLPTVATDDPLQKSVFNPIGAAAIIAKGIKKVWDNSTDDEKNGIIFEYFFQPTLEQVRTSNIQNSPAGKLFRQQIESHVSEAEVVLSKTLGTSTLGKSLAKTKGYDPSKIDRGSNQIFQPDQR